jgi:hypothetical protein
VQAAAALAEDFLRGLGAAVADGLEGGEGAGDARVETEVAVAFDEVEAAFEFGEEEVDLWGRWSATYRLGGSISTYPQQEPLLGIHDVSDD